MATEDVLQLYSTLKTSIDDAGISSTDKLLEKLEAAYAPIPETITSLSHIQSRLNIIRSHFPVTEQQEVELTPEAEKDLIKTLKDITNYLKNRLEGATLLPADTKKELELLQGSLLEVADKIETAETEMRNIQTELNQFVAENTQLKEFTAFLNAIQTALSDEEPNNLNINIKAINTTSFPKDIKTKADELISTIWQFKKLPGDPKGADTIYDSIVTLGHRFGGGGTYDDIHETAKKIHNNFLKTLENAIIDALGATSADDLTKRIRALEEIAEQSYVKVKEAALSLKDAINKYKSSELSSDLAKIIKLKLTELNETLGVKDDSDFNTNIRPAIFNAAPIALPSKPESKPESTSAGAAGTAKAGVLPEVKPSNNLNAILEELTALKEKIKKQEPTVMKSSKNFMWSNRSSFKDFVHRLENRITVLQRMPFSQELTDDLNKFENQLINTNSEFRKKYEKVPPIPELLNQFSELCKEAVKTIKEESKNRMWVPAGTEANVLTIRTGPNETEEQAIGKMMQAFLGNPPGVSGVAGEIRGAPPTIGTSHEIIRHDQLLACKIETSDKENIMGHATTIKDGQVKSTVYRMPENFGKIWDGLRSNKEIEGYFTENPTVLPALKEIEKKLKPGDGDQEIMQYITEVVKGDSNAANYLYREFAQARYTALYNPETKFPNDDLIKLVISQVDVLKKLKPNDPVFITHASNEAYAKAVMLYSLAQDYDVRNRSEDMQHIKMPSQKEVDNFRIYLKQNKDELGYTDRREADLIAQKAIAQERKQPKRGR